MTTSQLLLPVAVVDAWGFALADPADGSIVGTPGIEISKLMDARFALLGRRVWHAPGDSATYGLDFTSLISADAAIGSAAVAPFTNTVAPTATTDLTIAAIATYARIVYARVTGGVLGSDYQLRFTASDTQGNVFTRAALLLCTQ
jgi:hypothetical protein